MENIAFILGNGSSRKDIDLNTLISKGRIFGCNALYRDFKNYDYLVAIDERMIKELTSAPIDQKKVIIPKEDKRWESIEYNPSRRRSNAGMNAMEEAIERGHNMLYCFGFDFILNSGDALSNIYKNSKNYEKHTQSNANDNYNRIKYLMWFINEHKKVKFIFVVPDKIQTRKMFGGSSNIFGIEMSTMISKLKEE
jgi:hypothetical protein